ncbi:MAG: hypothetical protein AUK47_28140 [Deltaproteobacteria bacterium CG2_30_63_29]|nr:MAG: hypothetical protein AUK47_28140 [Deltaproteobacteria bacterium CG2_30_63_29]
MRSCVTQPLSPSASRSPTASLGTRIQEQRAEAEAKRLALRAEADKLMRNLGHESSSRASHLLAERIGAIEAELEPIHTLIGLLDGQMQALQVAAEQVTQTMRILEVFDEAWAAFNVAERQELVLILVERVVVNEPAGKLDILFHDLGGPFTASPEDEQADDDAPAEEAAP